MYILIKNNDHTLKSEINKLIEDKKLNTWQFITEEDRTRLVHIGEDNKYSDVVLRFITSYVDGVDCLKIVPSVRKDTNDTKTAQSHFGIVLAKFSEVLNSHFAGIGSYETVLS